MKKIVNWTFGSFFRTFGRFIFYILIGFIISIIFSNIKLPKFNFLDLIFTNVYADIRIPSDIVINNSSNSFDGYQYIGNSTDNSNVDLRVAIVEDITYAVDHPFLIVDICSSADIYVDRASSVGSSCTNSCFSNAVAKMKTTTSCKTNGVGGVIYRVQTQILKWSIGTQFYSLDDRFYVSVPNSGNNYLSVYGVYLSNDDIMSNDFDYTSNFNQIDNTISNKADSIINNQNQNTQDVIDNQNQNTQDVIDNQNANTDREIESQKVCTNVNVSIKSTNKDNFTIGYLNSSGNIISNNGSRVSDYIYIFKDGSYSLKLTSWTLSSYYYCLYDTNKTLISCSSQSSTNISIIPNANGFVRFSALVDYIGYNSVFSGQGCKNGNQATNDTLNDIGSKLTDSTPPSNLDSLNNSAGWLPAGPVDSILNLPLSFLTNLNSNLSKSCEPVNLPLPYINKNLPLPCVNGLYSQINGLSNWINTIGVIASAFILFGYFINLYKYIDDTLTFRENNYIDNWSGV